jgi:hypothetical protein
LRALVETYTRIRRMAAKPAFLLIAPTFEQERKEFTAVTEVDDESMEKGMSVPRSMGSTSDLVDLPAEVCNKLSLTLPHPEPFPLTLPRLRPRGARLKTTLARPRPIYLRVSNPSVG